MSTKLNYKGVSYYLGSDTLVIDAEKRDKRGTSTFQIHLKPSLVAEIGAALGPVLHIEDSGARGHAFWHWQTGRAKTGCDSCAAREEMRGKGGTDGG